MNNRLTHDIIVYTSEDKYETFGLPKKLVEWPGFIAGLLAQVPQDKRDSVVVNFEIPYNEYRDSADITISYPQQETDEEYAARLEKGRLEAHRQREAQTQAELKMLAALKAKYDR